MRESSVYDTRMYVYAIKCHFSLPCKRIKFLFSSLNDIVYEANSRDDLCGDKPIIVYAIP